MGSEWLHTLDAEGRTPLDRAYKGGHPALAEMMLRQEKADLALALSSETPLHRAAYLGLASAVKSLITYGATDEAVDEFGETPLHKAVRQGHKLHQLGIDHEALTYRFGGRDFRLTDVHGNVIREILA